MPFTSDPWRTVLRDALVVAAWVALASAGWRFLDGPTWAYYVVVFGGIVGYSLASAPWRLPVDSHSAAHRAGGSPEHDGQDDGEADERGGRHH